MIDYINSMQLSRFEHLYLRFSSSDVSFKIIGINLITSKYSTNDILLHASSLYLVDTIGRHSKKLEKVHANPTESRTSHRPLSYV